MAEVVTFEKEQKIIIISSRKVEKGEEVGAAHLICLSGQIVPMRHARTAVCIMLRGVGGMGDSLRLRLVASIGMGGPPPLS